MSDRPRPGPGWMRVGGAVWGHASGIRLHIGGLVRLADGSLIWADMWPESARVSRFIRIAGGNRKRGLMIWAMSKAFPIKEDNDGSV